MAGETVCCLGLTGVVVNIIDPTPSDYRFKMSRDPRLILNITLVWKPLIEGFNNRDKRLCEAQSMAIAFSFYYPESRR